jgi:uncharacterized protein YoxC
MDSQTLLVIVIALLSINLLFVGIYIALVLKEVRESVKKFNEMLETANQVTKAVAAPIITASGTLEAFVQGVKTVKLLKSKRERGLE